MSKGTQGKWAEGEVKKYLQRLGDRWACFDWDRIPDARASKGRNSTEADADFQAFMAVGAEHCYGADNRPASRNFLLEVKEVIDIPNRLPYKNFDTGAVSRMVKRQLAGCEGWVLVCHRPEDVWRAVPLAIFRERNARTPSGSWLLTDYPTTTLAEAMTTIFGIQP